MVLLEFLIASALAVVVSSMISMALYQMFAVSKTVNDMIDFSMKYALLQEHLEHDLMGVYIPQESIVIKNGAADRQEQPQKIGYIFEGISNKDMFFSMTFITDNPLLITDKDFLHANSVRTVRVVYKLIGQEGQRNSYILTRQEGSNLDFSAYGSGSKIRFYEVVSGIKHMAVKYGFYENQDAEKKGKISFTTEWKDKKIAENGSKKETITVPVVISFTIEFWDNQFEKSQSQLFIIPLIARPSAPVEIEEKEKTSDKQESSSDTEKNKEGEDTAKKMGDSAVLQKNQPKPSAGGVI